MASPNRDRLDGPWLEFEKPIVELERKILDLKEFAHDEHLEFSDEVKKLEKKAEKLRSDVYSNLTRWQRVQLARHPRRPYTLDYVRLLTDSFLEITAIAPSPRTARSFAVWP